MNEAAYHFLVYHSDGHQPADIISDATIWVCPILSEGNCAEGDQDSKYLQGHHSLRIPAVDWFVAGNLATKHGSVANENRLRLMRKDV